LEVGQATGPGGQNVDFSEISQSRNGPTDRKAETVNSGSMTL